MDLIFASGNLHKIKEISSIIGPYYNIKGLMDFNISEDIPEHEDTIEGNALLKARYVHRITGLNVFADDTGLETEALNGMPGVHSARFAGENKDSAANIKKLLSLLEHKENRKARFKTVIALIWDDEEYIFEGIVNGNIINEERGSEGFGYDPVFVPKGYLNTFAEMSLAEKNSISHRARALRKLHDFLALKASEENNMH